MTIQVHDTERNEPGGPARFTGPEFLDYAEQNNVFDGVIGSAEPGRALHLGRRDGAIRGLPRHPGHLRVLRHARRCSAG